KDAMTSPAHDDDTCTCAPPAATGTMLATDADCGNSAGSVQGAEMTTWANAPAPVGGTRTVSCAVCRSVSATPAVLGDWSSTSKSAVPEARSTDSAHASIP